MGQPGSWSDRRSQRGRSGATRRFNEGTTGWCANRGDPEIHQPVPEDTGSGATRRLIVGDTGGCEAAGQPGDFHNRHRRRMRESGRLEDPSPVKPEMQDEGQPETCIRGAARSAGTGATWNFITGSAEDAKVRGNSNPIAGTAKWTEDRGQPEDSVAGAGRSGVSTGQPGDASVAEREDAESGATRNLIEKAERDDA